jgi:hypothetical protein
MRAQCRGSNDVEERHFAARWAQNQALRTVQGNHRGLSVLVHGPTRYDRVLLVLDKFADPHVDEAYKVRDGATVCDLSVYLGCCLPQVLLHALRGWYVLPVDIKHIWLIVGIYLHILPSAACLKACMPETVVPGPVHAALDPSHAHHLIVIFCVLRCSQRSAS